MREHWFDTFRRGFANPMFDYDSHVFQYKRSESTLFCRKIHVVESRTRTYMSNHRVETRSWIGESNQWVEPASRIKDSNQCVEPSSRNKKLNQGIEIMNGTNESAQVRSRNRNNESNQAVEPMNRASESNFEVYGRFQPFSFENWSIYLVNERVA